MNTAVSIHLINLIASDSILAEALGSRIHPDKAPKGTPNPCLVYQFTAGNFEEMLDAGAVVEGEFVYQLRLYADSRMLANKLRDRLRILLQSAQGAYTVNDGEQNLSARILYSKCEFQADTFEDGNGKESDSYGALSLWSVTSSQALAS